MIRSASVRLFRSAWVSVPSRCFSSTSPDVVVEKLTGDHEGVTVFGFNRPAAKNAISKNLLKEFMEAIEDVRHSRDVRVVVLRSLVPGIFCAGADLKERAKMKPEEVGPFVAKARSCISDIENHPCL